MFKTKGTTKVMHRSSVDGEFVTKQYADAQKRITERQHVRVPPPAPKKRGK
jgi:hypothetical protein